MCQYKESLEAFPFHGHTSEVTLPTASLQEVSPSGCTHHAQNYIPADHCIVLALMYTTRKPL